MKQLVESLRQHSNVGRVTHSFDIYNIEDAIRVEDFVDAECKNGDDISWYLEFTLDTERVAIEADIRRFHNGEDSIIAAIANSVEQLTPLCADHISEVAKRLRECEVAL